MKTTIPDSDFKFLVTFSPIRPDWMPMPPKGLGATFKVKSLKQAYRLVKQIQKKERFASLSFKISNNLTIEE